MNISFWNVRGLNKSSKQHLIKLFLSQYHLSYIALLETKIRESRLKDVAKKIAKNWNWLSNVTNHGKARIWIMWNPNILDIQVNKISDQSITCKVQSLDERMKCVITSIYGLNQMQARKDLWLELKMLQLSTINEPWLLCGDFNTVISNDEKFGGSILSEADTKDFRDCIKDCNLNHLKTTGCFYTWNNKQDQDSRVWSRLDMALVNDAWIHLYTSSQVEFLLPRFSDHFPALVYFYDECPGGKKPFKFFNMWTKHDSFLLVVTTIWQTKIDEYKMYSVCMKLKQLRGALKDINKKHYYNISEQVQRAKFALDEAQGNL
ncbi:uncharacterized protein LOC109832477 [Asparagus officinalis]|uniref:uncharacterized protein LOC109832477 n=1 Tax=Asparagus officinalis TaxID=4686 RepID=UPI00098DFBB1|nr:uncharacterized protein LOC109832477 [Asparagus officinalis]